MYSGTRGPYQQKRGWSFSCAIRAFPSRISRLLVPNIPECHLPIASHAASNSASRSSKLLPPVALSASARRTKSRLASAIAATNSGEQRNNRPSPTAASRTSGTTWELPRQQGEQCFHLLWPFQPLLLVDGDDGRLAPG